MTTTVEYIRYRIASDDRQPFEDAYRKAAESLAATPSTTN